MLTPWLCVWLVLSAFTSLLLCFRLCAVGARPFACTLSPMASFMQKDKPLRHGRQGGQGLASALPQAIHAFACSACLPVVGLSAVGRACSSLLLLRLPCPPVRGSSAVPLRFPSLHILVAHLPLMILLYFFLPIFFKVCSALFFFAGLSGFLLMISDRFAYMIPSLRSGIITTSEDTFFFRTKWIDPVPVMAT